LASTIKRDDIIAVIGASRSSLSALAGGGIALFDLCFMADMCQQNLLVPRFLQSLTLSSIYYSLFEKFSIATNTAAKPGGRKRR
jgi:hypothetical protein